jgi:Flp pilus assembly protein TadG
MAKRARLENQRGQSLVEVALITPLLLIALYIPADFGVAFFMGNLVQSAAREGARIGSGLQKTGTAPDFTFSSTQANTVKTEVLSRMPGLLKNKSVAVKFYTGTACMEFVEVRAQGDYNFFLYQVMRLFGGTTPDFITLSRTTQVRYVYQPYTNTEYCTGSTTF